MKIVDTKGTEKGNVDLPKQFSEEFRPDLIKRAVLALQTHRLQPKGTKTGAGERHAGYMSKRRQEFRTTYGRNQARTPRKIVVRQGEQFRRIGANVPNAVGGRIAHPPKVEKVISEKINDKERKKAIRSALYATTVKELVEARNHRITEVKQIQADKESVEEAEQGKQVALSLPDVTVGRQINENQTLYSAIPEEHFRKLKELKKLLSPEEKETIKEIAEIKRRDNVVWGV